MQHKFFFKNIGSSGLEFIGLIIIITIFDSQDFWDAIVKTYVF
jgi:hypothetical protein